MGILSWLSSFQAPKKDFCSDEFRPLWSSFVDCFVDSIHARMMPASPPSEQEVTELPSVLPAAKRLIAIGDLHGDFEKTRQAFQLGGLADKDDNWIGGDTICVQVGDQLDRGDHEVSILYYLERLQRQASRAGGALHVMNGNHETMNMNGRFKYCTEGALMSFLRWNVVQSIGLSMKSKCGCDPGHSAVGNPEGFPIEYLPAMASAARWAAVRPGGPMAKRFFARHPTVLQVGSTLFVHGGLLPDHVQYGVNKINKESQMWMLGNSQIRNIPRVLAGKNAVVWTREYSWEEPKDCNCEKLKAVLDAVPGADRMVVGHTIQDAGINSACNGMVYRIDVGMSKGCGDHDVQVLEILEDKEIRRLGWDANGKPKVIGHEDAWTLNTFFGAVRSAVGSAKPA